MLCNENTVILKIFVYLLLKIEMFYCKDAIHGLNIAKHAKRVVFNNKQQILEYMPGILKNSGNVSQKLGRMI